MQLDRRCAFIILFLLTLALAATPVAAQRNGNENSDIMRRLEALEAQQRLLKNEILVLQDRLDAIAPTGDPERVFDIPIGQSPVLGEPSAPLTLVIFGDYQSAYTNRAQTVVDSLLDTYAGRLKVVYKQLPLTDRHPQASAAALSAIAAQLQDKFWEMHQRLIRYSRRLDADIYPLLATEIGLDIVRFHNDRNSLLALERLGEDEKLAARLGVDAVPTFFLNGRRLSTWRYDYLREQIDRLLGR